MYGYVFADPVNWIDPTGEFIWVLIPIVIYIVDGVMTASDAIDTYQTITDPCSSGTDKFIAGGLFAATVFLPGRYGWVDDAAKRTKKVEPIKDASGAHTTWKSDPQTGEITRHETWTPNPRNSTGWDKVQSTDLKGAPHINKQTGEAVPTPHTQGKSIPGGVRSADPSEMPKGNHYNY